MARSLMAGMLDLCRDTVTIARVSTAAPDPATGAAVEIETTLVQDAPASLQGARATTENGGLDRGVNRQPVPPTAHRLFMAYVDLGDVPHVQLRVTVNGRRYPLLRAPIDVGGQRDTLQFHLGEAAP